uniref:Uncharacterized protein n=1 Tax=Siphoviridae sp. ctNEy24 TaxID=2825466 RepID=A0A8S5U0G5_9CAUD|nr:MAG TPA: hypothetical protein [Siphoviridae sp. ctNEy24]
MGREPFAEIRKVSYWNYRLYAIERGRLNAYLFFIHRALLPNSLAYRAPYSVFCTSIVSLYSERKSLLYARSNRLARVA